MAICGQVAPVATAIVPARATAAVLRCEQCGAAVAFTAEAQGLRCIFCTCVLRLEQPVDPVEAAETILPFRVDPAAADAALHAWLRTLGSFRPKDLAETARLDVPLACDGALCDTTNGAETGGSCSLSAGRLRDAKALGAPPIGWAVLCAGLLLRARRRSSAATVGGVR